MYVADMHCDSLLTVSAKQGLISKYNLSENHPQLQFFAAFVPRADDPPQVRRKKTKHLLDVYTYERDRLGLLPLEGARDVNIAKRQGVRSSIFSIEGGGGLFSTSEELDTFYRMGLRVLGLAWDTNELAASAWDKNDTGLSEEGVALALRASEMGIILDVSHLSDRSFYQLLELTAYPLIATHSNFREICNSPRNLTIDMAKRIAARGGVIGLNLYPGFLREEGKPSEEDIIRHVDYALENLGEDVLGFGFDIDGTDGQYPQGFSEDSSIHDRVIELLLRRYPVSTVEKIVGGNVLDFLESNL